VVTDVRVGRAPVLAIVACAAALVVGTVHAAEKITFTPKGSEKYPAKPATCEIAVFQDTAKPDRPHTEIGVLNYHDERHRTDTSALTLAVALPKMKAAACKAGGDALMEIRVTEAKHLEWALFNVRAVVVRYGAR
jgi:hypothetical protein